MSPVTGKSRRPDPRPEGQLIQAAQRGRSAAALAPLAGISNTRWRHIVNGYQPMGAGQDVAVVAPATTLARMARAVGVTPEQLVEVGREDAALELRQLPPAAGVGVPGVDLPPLPPELDDLIAIYVSAEDDEREVILGQVRFLLRAIRPARERH